VRRHEPRVSRDHSVQQVYTSSPHEPDRRGNMTEELETLGCHVKMQRQEEAATRVFYTHFKCPKAFWHIEKDTC